MSMSPTRRKPLVSVIIPVYNAECFLAEAIESVLAQTYRELQIIVVNDGSTDDSAGVAARYASEVDYHHQSNAGVGAARNRGIELAQGSFFSFLDADDLWVADKTEIQLAAFEQDPSLDIVLGQAIQFRDARDEGATGQIPNQHGGIVPGLVPGALLIRKDSFFQVGLFSSELQVGEWADWYLRATECGLKSATLPQVVLKRRLHGDNIGVRMRDSQVQYVRVLKAALDRRRKKAQPGSQNTSMDSETQLDRE